jgi:hypothetical protein
MPWITTSHSAEGAKKYFAVSLKTSDYYTKDISTWGGKGSEMLGLNSEVERKDFVASGSPLMRETGNRTGDRRARDSKEEGEPEG